MCNFAIYSSDWHLEHFQWNCLKGNTSGLHRWYVSIAAFAKLRRHVGFYRCWLVKSDVMSSNIGFFGRCDSWTPFRVSQWEWSIKTQPFHTQKSSIFQWNYAWKPTWPWQIRLWWWAKMRELANLRSAPVCRNFLLVIQARISKM